MLDRISIELTNRCGKGCSFCYNASSPDGATEWSPPVLVDFVKDCAANGVRAVSFGGGEPLEYAGLFETLVALDGVLFRSLTTNGLLLTPDARRRLRAARPDKIHVSIHFPDRDTEVERVAGQVGELAADGIASGVNLLVRRSGLDAALRAAVRLHEGGIGNDRIVYLPMRGQDTPSPAEIARVAGGRFQSMTCLTECAASPRFCSISWDRRVGWCSYTTTRRALGQPTWAALQGALAGLGLTFCGGTDDGTIRLSRRSQHGHDMVRG